MSVAAQQNTITLKGYRVVVERTKAYSYTLCSPCCRFVLNILLCNTLVVRCSRQLTGPADWVFVILGPLSCA